MNLSPAEYRALLRNHLPSFIERCFRRLNPQQPYLSNWHIDVIADRLISVREGRTKRLIINLPPRHLKSISVTIAFIAFYLGWHPSRSVIAASYGQDLSDKLARDCRMILTSPFYQACFPTRLLAERKAVADFMTVQGGSRMATSVGGVLTGRGADLIVIDDALKPDEALSETRRKAVNDWYDNSVVSRLNDKEKGAIIITMQRLHQDDLVGHVLEQEGWEVLSLPAIAEDDEVYDTNSIFGHKQFSRRAKEVLHPARESAVTLKNIRETIGEYNFLSQYQQTPIPKGGAMVKQAWLRFYDPAQPPKCSWIVHSWDTANKTSELNDFSVCTTWGYANGKFVLLDVVRKRLNYPDLKREVLNQQQKFDRGTIIIEDKASGTQLIQDLQRDGLLNVHGIENIPGTDKIMRLHSTTTLFENGAVLLPQTALWLNDYVAELTGFPGTKFDDQVDSTTQALQYLQGPANSLLTWIRCGSGYGR
jgi:predicted phage terminase large subunit-like protein